MTEHADAFDQYREVYVPMTEPSKTPRHPIVQQWLDEKLDTGGCISALETALSEERSRARELWTALANLSFHCDGVVVTCPPPRTVYNQSFAVMDRFKPLYGPEAPKK